MQYSRESVGSLQLEDYVVKIAEIYRANDRNRSLWDVWCHALHHAAGVVERIRKKAPAVRVFEEIADFSLWLFTAVHKLEGRLGESREKNEIPPETLIRIQSGCSDLLWQRYPRICPVCYVRRVKHGDKFDEGGESLRPCDCSSPVPDEPQKKDEKRAALEAVRRFAEDTQSRKPKTIDEWQEMFATVFHSNLSQLTISEVTLHLMEELGEASDAMVRMYSYRPESFVGSEPRQRQLRLESQIADVFSWLFALVSTINLSKDQTSVYQEWPSRPDGANRETIRLSEIIWRRYGSDQLNSFFCPFCEQAVCSCPLVFVPATRSMEELKDLLKE